MPYVPRGTQKPRENKALPMGYVAGNVPPRAAKNPGKCAPVGHMGYMGHIPAGIPTEKKTMDSKAADFLGGLFGGGAVGLVDRPSGILPAPIGADGLAVDDPDPGEELLDPGDVPICPTCGG